MNRTKIEYLDFTWNPIVGCSGADCEVRRRGVCWAMAMAKRQKQRCQLCYDFLPHFHEERLTEPLHRKKPTRIGVCFMGELLDGTVRLTWLTEIFNVMRIARQHTFVNLTKQAMNLQSQIIAKLLPSNLWLGVSVNRKADLWRLGYLKQTKATVKIVSFEPLYECMGDIDLEGIDWIIIGAQTHPDLQPDTSWVTPILREASTHEIAVFIKNNLWVTSKCFNTLEALGHKPPFQEFPNLR